MATITVVLTEVKKRKTDSNIIFTAKRGNDYFTREVGPGEFATWQDFSKWILSQSPEFEVLPDKQKTLTITFHTETIEGQTIKIFDSVVVT